MNEFYISQLYMGALQSIIFVLSVPNDSKLPYFAITGLIIPRGTILMFLIFFGNVQKGRGDGE